MRVARHADTDLGWRAVLFLVSDDSDFIVGDMLFVDGGVSAILVAVTVVGAGGGPTRQELAVHGLDLRRQRRDAEALVEFRAAYGIQKSSRALAQIALAQLPAEVRG